jgi:hypothetical protein
MIPDRRFTVICVTFLITLGSVTAIFANEGGFDRLVESYGNAAIFDVKNGEFTLVARIYGPEAPPDTLSNMAAMPYITGRYIVWFNSIEDLIKPDPPCNRVKGGKVAYVSREKKTAFMPLAAAKLEISAHAKRVYQQK